MYASSFFLTNCELNLFVKFSNHRINFVKIKPVDSCPLLTKLPRKSQSIPSRNILVNRMIPTGGQTEANSRTPQIKLIHSNPLALSAFFFLFLACGNSHLFIVFSLLAIDFPSLAAVLHCDCQFNQTVKC